MIDIVVNLDVYTDLYFSNGLDAPYTLRNEIKIYIKPILVKDYPLYLDSIDVLQLRKNDINDIKIIQMSYLEYLVDVVFAQDPNQEYEAKFRYIIEKCLGEKYIGFVTNDKGKKVIAVCDEFRKIKYIITSTELEDIITIILNQNDATYDNRYISPDVREAMEDYHRIKYADINPPSLEKRKAFVCSKLSKTFSDLSEMNVREFELIYKACIDSEIYIATKVTEASYKYEVKNPTQHPLYRREEDPYAEIFTDTSALNNKGLKGAENIGLGI